jgi:hypothetical protein
MSQNPVFRHGPDLNSENIGAEVIRLGKLLNELNCIPKNDTGALRSFYEQYKLRGEATFDNGIKIITERIKTCLEYLQPQAYMEGGVALQSLNRHLLASFERAMARLNLASDWNTDFEGADPNKPLFVNPIDTFTAIAKTVRSDDIFAADKNVVSFRLGLEALLEQWRKYDESITTENEQPRCPNDDLIQRVVVQGIGLLSAVEALAKAKKDAEEGAAS